MARFNLNGPVLVQDTKYEQTCEKCEFVVPVGSPAYYLSKQRSPRGSSMIWHTECYEQTRGGSTPLQHKGPEEEPVPQSGPGSGNSPDPAQGPDGEEGGGMNPLMSDLVCQILYDPEKLARHLHREDVHDVLRSGWAPWSISQLRKEELVMQVVTCANVDRDAEQRTGRAPENLLRADEKIRRMMKLPPRPPRPDAGQDPAALQQQVEQQQEQIQNALAEAEEALRLAEEAEEAAKAAQGKVVEIKTPEGQTISLDGKHFKFPDLAQLVGAGVPVLIVGPAGGGKTEACRSLADDLGQEFMPLSLGPQTTQASLFGYTDAQGQYVRTPFREAFESGGLILLDEFDRCNERVSVTLNAAIAQRYCAFPDGTIHAHDKCVFVAAANTAGHGANRQYVSARQQDAATLDRFAVLDWPYDEHFETKITLAQGLDEEDALTWLREVRETRKAVAELALRYLVSPRAAIHGAKLMASGASKQLATDTILYRGWRAEDRHKVEARATQGGKS